jgi:hypothetical protein
MQVNDAMTDDVKLANPNQTICDAARLMAQLDVGCCRSERTTDWSA